jgi:hypothetical protein
MQLKGVMHRILQDRLTTAQKSQSAPVLGQAFGRELRYRQQAERSHDLGCESIRQPVV